MPGSTAKNWISQLNPADFDAKTREFGQIFGEKLGKLHRGGLIHGDLTTSNIILRDDDLQKMTFIDFGLSSQGKVNFSGKWGILRGNTRQFLEYFALKIKFS